MLHPRTSSRNGVTAVEVLVTIAIMGLLLTIGIIRFSGTRNEKELQITTDAIVLKMQETRTNAVTGKQGQNYGVKFNTSSYVTFGGSSYIPSNQANQTFSLGSKFIMSNTIPGTDDAIIFSRMSGNTGSTATITVSVVDQPTIKRDIVVGPTGEISVVAY